MNKWENANARRSRRKTSETELEKKLDADDR